MIERFGLREQATRLIGKVRNVTTSRLLSIYLLVREIAGLASIRIGGHPQFVRPLINPMVQSALRTKYHIKEEDVDDKDVEKLKAEASAMENYGNFFGQNLFVGAAGILLMVGTFKSLKIDVNAIDLALASVPIAIITFLLVWVKNIRLEQKLAKKYSKREVTKNE